MTSVLYNYKLTGRFDKKEYEDSLTAYGNIRRPLVADVPRSVAAPIWSYNQEQINTKNSFNLFGSMDDYLRGVAGEVPEFIELQKAKGGLPEPYVDPKVAQFDRNFLGNDIDNVPNFAEINAARRGSFNVTNADLHGQIFSEQPSDDFLQMKTNEAQRVTDFLARSII